RTRPLWVRSGTDLPAKPAKSDTTSVMSPYNRRDLRGHKPWAPSSHGGSRWFKPSIAHSRIIEEIGGRRVAGFVPDKVPDKVCTKTRKRAGRRAPADRSRRGSRGYRATPRTPRPRWPRCGSAARGRLSAHHHRAPRLAAAGARQLTQLSP